MLAKSFVFSVDVYQLLHDVRRSWNRSGTESVGNIKQVIFGLRFQVGPSLKKSKLSKQMLDSVWWVQYHQCAQETGKLLLKILHSWIYLAYWKLENCVPCLVESAFDICYRGWSLYKTRTYGMMGSVCPRYFNVRNEEQEAVSQRTIIIAWLLVHPRRGPLNGSPLISLSPSSYFALLPGFPGGWLSFVICVTFVLN